MSSVLQARGLGKKYGRKWALSDCTLDVPVGRVVGMVGPNGAGKSTFLNLAVGMLTPSAGEIEVLGARPTGRDAQRAKVGYVGQDTPTYAGLSVADHLQLGAASTPAGTPRSPTTASLASGSISSNAPDGSRAASGHSWRSRSGSRSDPSCCCSTSRWRASTRWRAGSSCRT